MTDHNPYASGVLLLQTKLIHDYTEEQLRIFQQDALLGSDTTIIRDFLVPSDMTLYSLHYALQSAYGWNNSHLHCFKLPKEEQDRFAETIEDWQKLCGVLFRSPFMEEDGRFWMDDDEQAGSVRAWMRRKYPGPYIHTNRWETLELCQQDAANIVAGYYRTKKKDGSEEEPWYFSACDGNPFELLEQLSIEQLFQMKRRNLIYQYDFGDNWKIEIQIQKAYGVHEELVSRCLHTYRPVCVRRVGLSLLDDVGGTDGYFDFLRSLHLEAKVDETGDPYYIDEYGVTQDSEEIGTYTDRKSSLGWASMFGWKDRLQVPKDMF